MELKFQKADVKRLYNGDYELTLTISKGLAAELERFVKKFKPGETWDATLKKHRKKRSQDANSYCWVLLRKIADHLAETNPGTKTPTVEELYKNHVRELNIYEPLPVKEEAVEKFGEAWGRNGIGWFITKCDKCRLPGYVRIHAYYGSSTYDSKEMARLIDNISQDCHALGIETLPPQELKQLLESWETVKGGKKK